MIPEELKQELIGRVHHALTPREAAIDVLKTLQRHYGWLTDEAVVEASEIIGISPLQIEELATFYEKIYRRPMGKRVVHVCDSISCWATGSETILDHLRRVLGVNFGGTTADGLFTLVPCCCLGNCGEGPTMMVGDNLYNRVTPELCEEILAREKQELIAGQASA